MLKDWSQLSDSNRRPADYKSTVNRYEKINNLPLTYLLNYFLSVIVEKRRQTRKKMTL